MRAFEPDAFRRHRLVAPGSLPAGVLIDQTRERTSWAEGMFVTAAQFNRDQSYVVARQSDLGRAVGAGVVDGLTVERVDDDPTALVVRPGLGIGGGGETILLVEPARLSLSDIPLQRALARGAGLEKGLQLVSETRSGLFVLCAVPVEYGSNPIGSYATEPDGRRRLQDSVINEATLFTLAPFALSLGRADRAARRALATRRIFLEGAAGDLPPSALPLAMVELEGNVVAWLDMHLARREAGAARADAFGLGFVDTPGRIAHFRQFAAEIEAIVAAEPSRGFAAHDRFEVLPPMGPMPAACVAPRAPAPGQAAVLSHSWLPAEMPVELTALPEDEIGQLLEESLTLPPIDLAAPPAALAQTPVTIIVPMPRADWASAPLEVAQAVRALVPAAPLGAPPRTPMELITALLERAADPALVDPTVDAPWLALLAGRSTLWFTRRRQFLRTDALAGEASPYVVSAPAPAPTDFTGPILDSFDRTVAEAARPWGLAGLRSRLSPAATADGHLARAQIEAAVGRALAAEAPLVAADLLRRAAQAGEIGSEAARGIVALYADFDLAGRFGPFDGFLTGGPVDLVVPDFPGRTGETAISTKLAQAFNLRVQPVAPAPAIKLPPDMDARVKELLTVLGVEEKASEAILARGGGVLPLADPRDLDRRAEAMKAAISTEVPILARTRAPGTVEAQTRRNLVATTDLLPDLARKLEMTGLRGLFEPLLAHMQAMNGAMGASAERAIAAATASVTSLIEA